ncbi:SusC/RagA family TonB-linked outer membrane protein [uncultured Capnocytophaga sp.]|uniref:SusC/RagA family TonB-linked outer membrane protein n=1 Tax=uncultured Capnocytophaga sp. TaxID=159273 RepID=UPI0025939D4A|nr:SusC/RagA family TonB-linked outer membrane protein [uncultured Capnocytophaga sp.]
MNILKRFCLWALCLLPLLAGAQSVDLQGTVKDTKGEPLLGVFILVKGTQRGATTDFDGNYSLRANVGDVLKFSFLGLKTVEKKVAAGVTHINITMEDDVQELEGTVVTGYGGKKIASRTVASVATVQGKEFAQTPNANAIDALQGKVAGMVVTTESGKPGAGSSVLIHGLNTYFSVFDSTIVSEPLYVVDGATVSGDIMTMYNPNDIESVTVLKDAASTSIYGARAANGVILITTKKGKRNERTNVTISHQLGFSIPTNVMNKFFDNMVTPREYMDFWIKKEPRAIISLGRRLGYTETTPEAITDRILAENPHNTRWDKVFFHGYAPVSRTDISLSGGSLNTSYYLSFGYLDQQGMKTRSAYQRYTLNANIDTQVAEWLKAGVSVSLGHSSAESVAGDASTDILSLPIYSPTDNKGKRKDYIFSILGVEQGFYHPDYLAEKRPGDSYGENIMPIGYLQIEPIKNLTFKTQLGIQYNIGEGYNRNLPSFVEYRGTGETVSSASRNINKNLQRTYTNLLEYKWNIANLHNFDFLLGQESLESVGRSFSGRSLGQPSDGLMMLSLGTQQLELKDSQEESGFNSYFGRVEYSYKNRYFLDLSARRDGSSAFGANNRYANFWAFGAMWKLKEEAFLKQVDWLTSLDLRFSTGLSGNSSIGQYNNRTLISPSNNYRERPGYFLSSLGNPDIMWEEQQKTTLGLNVSIMKGTNLNVEVYERNTYKTLGRGYINSASGFTFISDNIGNMQNRGIDITFSTIAYRSQNNDWNIRPYFNMNYNQQKVKSLHLNKEFFANSFNNAGYKLNEELQWAMPIFKGLDKNGYAQWYLPKENYMEQQTDDSKVTYQYDPKKLMQNTNKKMFAPVNGGFGLTATYRNVSLDLAFSYSLGKWMINEDRYYTLNPGVFGTKNFSRELLNYWKQEGDDTEIPAINSSRFMEKDTRLLENASYMRLKSLGLSYSLPQQAIEDMRFFTGVRLYASARNLFTITKYTGADPEFANTISRGGYPPTRQFTIGVELKF